MEQSFTLRELQMLYLEMLKDFHNYCQQQGLTYYMVGGTLLGAVREKGFIPWDDDLDIAMPRSDYDRFLREYTGPMMLQSFLHNKDYCYPYAKLFNQEIPNVHIHDDKFGFCDKVFVQIDIYPLDGLGRKIKTAQKHVKNINRFKHVLYINQSKDKSRNIIKNIMIAFVRCIPGNALARHIDRLMRRYSIKNSNWMTRWRGGCSDGNIFSSDLFGEPKLLDFEDCQFYAPGEYDAYLTRVYGNYMVKKQENSGLRHSIDNNYQAKILAEIVKKN